MAERNAMEIMRKLEKVIRMTLERLTNAAQKWTVLTVACKGKVKTK
jgi:hypothetical protein